MIECVQEGDFVATAVLYNKAQGREIDRFVVGRYDMIDDARSAVSSTIISDEEVRVSGGTQQPVVAWQLKNGRAAWRVKKSPL